ncbi:SpoIID/LytB domain-containing protein [Oscillospiraceae bacterium LTW-04]|nr:SpoIID/LytB domain-containing protein [Oscillospiraceae bacterium MB24-C1]
MRLTIIEPNDSCREMRGSIDAMLAAMQLKAQEIICQNDRQSLAQAIATALSEAELVLVIGGMSHGGFAREAAADALGRPLVHSKAAAGYIEKRCREQDLVFSEFARCCNLPQGARSFAGDGLFPACLCIHHEHALLLFDEYDDPAQLFRLKTLLTSLFDSPDQTPIVVAEEQLPTEAAEPESLPLSAKAPEAKSPDKRHQAKKPPRSVRSQSKNGRKKTIVGCIAIACVLAVMALAGAAAALLGTLKNETPAQQTNASGTSEQLTVLGPVRTVPPWRLKASSSEKDTPSSQADLSSSESEASAPTASSVPEVSSPSTPAMSSSQAEAPSSTPVASSSAPEVSSSVPEPSSSVPAASSSAPETPSSSSEDETVYVYTGEDDEEDDPPRGSDDTPSAHDDAFDEKLSYTYGGSVRRMNAYDLVCQVLQNETRGNLAPEALKAHVVATYTMIKYNNAAGIAPSVLLNSNISSAVEDAVDAVLGVGVYYNGRYANTVYHSTSCGYTTSSQAVWGGALPYLVPVKSASDRKSPYYQSSYTISEDDFAAKVEKVYGIVLDGDPEDWISVERDAPGGYVGTVEIGGETRSQGGTYGTKLITGRSIREKLLSFALRSHCFDVEYNASKERFEFTVYGYGHGVGMSQYGAHYMALEGYDYVEILEHYYTDTEIY